MNIQQQRNKDRYEGMVFKTKGYGLVKVVQYKNSKEVFVEFLTTSYLTQTTLQKLQHGHVKDRSAPSVFGVGIIGDGVVWENGSHTNEYGFWSRMLNRCYNDKCYSKQQSYRDCSVSENFKHYTYFQDWCSKQVGFNVEGFALDKDILVKGNKVYSEDTCCFVPQEINSLMTKANARRGAYIIGVNFDKNSGKFRACVRIYGVLKHIGLFTTELEAFQSYKEAKEAHIKEVANKWKDQIDPRVYGALMNCEVSEND